ncbi:unnamed protein product [Cyprideis torosa]|uniref:Uncharacterized protein n=1 Tax=Cyprideis torosa TaxID=163714 RepID=A0A7R8WM48_9CRUS|nr:unnamed protein product [Cyprideis torosa]CAG0904977.1 unnamed protein product [Cyprideis torosa]
MFERKKIHFSDSPHHMHASSFMYTFLVKWRRHNPSTADFWNNHKYTPDRHYYSSIVVPSFSLPRHLEFHPLSFPSRTEKQESGSSAEKVQVRVVDGGITIHTTVRIPTPVYYPDDLIPPPEDKENVCPYPLPFKKRLRFESGETSTLSHHASGPPQVSSTSSYTSTQSIEEPIDFCLEFDLRYLN